MKKIITIIFAAIVSCSNIASADITALEKSIESMTEKVINFGEITGKYTRLITEMADRIKQEGNDSKREILLKAQKAIVESYMESLKTGNYGKTMRTVIRNNKGDIGDKIKEVKKHLGV